MKNDKKRKFNWSSLIGWLIFILIFAGRPLINALQRLVGGSAALPANLSSLIPVAMAALVVLSIAISVARALAGGRRGDTRLPTGGAAPLPRSESPMPPFAGPRPPTLPPPAPRTFTMPSGASQPQLPTPPRFEPIVSPRVLVFGILTLVALGTLGVIVLGLSLP